MSVSEALAIVERPPVPQRPWTTARVLGSALVVFWALALLGLIFYLYSAWNIELIDRYFPRYMSGLWVTVQLVIVSCVLGAILSLPIAYGRDAKNPFARAFTYGYVYFFRGTPLIAQTFLIYYGAGSLRAPLDAVGLWSFFREAWYCAIFAFSLNTAAYQAEILRGAIRSVSLGQWEGAAALGLSKWQTLRKVIAPQAMLVALRPYGNEVVLMVKGSAIVALITIMDLMGEANKARSDTYDIQALIWAAVIYLLIVETLRHGIEWIERRITKHLIR